MWVVCSDMPFVQSYIKIYQTEDAVVWSMVLRQVIYGSRNVEEDDDAFILDGLYFRVVLRSRRMEFST